MAVQQRVDRVGESPADGDSIELIGNATVLIRYGAFTILTDPNFVHRGVEVPLGYGLSTVRLTNPAMEIDQLPPLDLVLLSHHHGDHFDEVAERRLDRTIPIVTTPSAADTLRGQGFGAARGLETWRSVELAKGEDRLRISAMPGQHASGVISVALPDVMGSLLEFWRGADASRTPRRRRPAADGDRPPSLRLYISGDTVVYDGLDEIPRRHPEIDLALLHLGGTRVVGATVSMDAEQGVDLLRRVRPRMAIPIHYADYEAFKSPLADFVAAVNAAGWDDRVSYLLAGDRFVL
ncbi:MAG TPA: MBL fold metallo-hydrolase [candidate division Zixibacteria bacterium]|nr:MBL fold metallo-hydrolase [candidate division Zixibacteria bacterium]